MPKTLRFGTPFLAERPLYDRLLAISTSGLEIVPDPDVKAQIASTMEAMAIAPDAIARAIAFAIEQPADVDVGDIVVRPTAQG